MTLREVEVSFFNDYFKKLADVLFTGDEEALSGIADLLTGCHASGNKVMIAGNGGSAAVASHTATDLSNTAGIRAMSFNEASLITCLSNDYGYENWVAKALEFYAVQGDVVILISSSGESQNMINAANKALEMDVKIVTFSGFKPGNRLRQKGRFNCWADSCSYNLIETTHNVWLAAVIDRIAAMK